MDNFPRDLDRAFGCNTDLTQKIRIRYELDNGFTVECETDKATAMSIIRTTDDITKVHEGELLPDEDVVLVLPSGAITRVLGLDT